MAFLTRRKVFSLLPVLLATLHSTTTFAATTQQPLTEEHPSDWASDHMVSEHHINNFDASSFFHLHDYDSDSIWEPLEIRRTYGMAEHSTDGVGGSGATGNPSEARKREIVKDVLDRFDGNGDGVIQRMEFVEAWGRGERLKDFGHGPGHHGDDEYEYELHHYEKYHDENTKEEELTHPEDIAHFKSHDEMEDRAYAQGVQDQLAVVESNIPQMFRRS